MGSLGFMVALDVKKTVIRTKEGANVIERARSHTAVLYFLWKSEEPS